MKATNKLLLAITIIASIILASCGKYEDGPKISFASKKARLSGDWKIEKYMHNNSDQTSTIVALIGSGAIFDIEKNGKYKITTTAGTNEGTWKLGEDKDDITLTPNTAGAAASTYRILRLKSKELWWKETQTNGDVDEYHFKQ